MKMKVMWILTVGALLMGLRSIAEEECAPMKFTVVVLDEDDQTPVQDAMVKWTCQSSKQVWGKPKSITRKLRMTGVAEDMESVLEGEIDCVPDKEREYVVFTRLEEILDRRLHPAKE